jgi:PD-(D/E)XK nuclease superfamily
VRLPSVPSPAPLTRVSPSLYEALKDCRAKALWMAHGQRGEVPSHPSALLGTCFHEVVAAAAGARLSADDPLAAGRCFDEVATQAYEAAHPLIGVKFSSPQRIPYYFLTRERAGVYAAEHVEGPGAGDAGTGRAVVETALRSRDGLVGGRPDRIDRDGREVVDFKTGRVAAESAGEVSAREERQLRLYVGLALDNDLEVDRGTIVRGNGRRVSMGITREAAESELEAARSELRGFNEAVEDGADFEQLASPSVDACRFCPCIPFCDAFWRRAEPSWEEEVGAHAEGAVRDLTRADLEPFRIVSLEVDVRAGTVPTGTFWIEHVPEGWLTADGSAAIEAGDLLRLVDVRIVLSDAGPSLRADRIMTAIWRVGDSEEPMAAHDG